MNLNLTLLLFLILLSACDPFTSVERKTLKNAWKTFNAEQFITFSEEDISEIEEYCAKFLNEKNNDESNSNSDHSSLSPTSTEYVNILNSRRILKSKLLSENEDIFDKIEFIRKTKDSFYAIRLNLTLSRNTTDCYVSHSLNFNFTKEVNPTKKSVYQTISKDSKLSNKLQYIILIDPYTY